MITFYFVRHGKSQANQQNMIADDLAPLTKEGEAQARKVGRELKKLDVTVVATSPLDRARTSAEIIAKQLKVKEVVVIDELRERGLGELENHEKTQPNDWYYTAEGEMDIEPRGLVIARAEAALARIKKLAEQGNVAVVGHAVSGYYLREVAAGKRRFEQFAPPKSVPNGTFVKIDIIVPPTKNRRSLNIALAVGAAFLVLASVIATTAFSGKPATGVKQTSIPLSPSDYQDDPNLQGAIQKQLQAQGVTGQNDGSTQSPQTSATDPLQAGSANLQQ